MYVVQYFVTCTSFIEVVIQKQLVQMFEESNVFTLICKLITCQGKDIKPAMAVTNIIDPLTYELRRCTSRMSRF